MTLFGIKFAASAKQYVSRFATEHPVGNKLGQLGVLHRLSADPRQWITYEHIDHACASVGSP